jgi:hypothetical protein
MKVGDKVRCIENPNAKEGVKGAGWKLGLEFIITELSNVGIPCYYGGKMGNGVYGDFLELVEEEPKDDHYNNDNGSLYLFAQHHELNAYEFDILKRVVRCRKKGQFISDLEKTKRVIDLYIKEQSSNQ